MDTAILTFSVKPALGLSKAAESELLRDLYRDIVDEAREGVHDGEDILLEPLWKIYDRMILDYGFNPMLFVKCSTAYGVHLAEIIDEGYMMVDVGRTELLVKDVFDYTISFSGNSFQAAYAA